MKSSGSESPWLVIIDMQTIFREKKAWWVPTFDEVITPIRKLAGKFAGRTILTRFVAGSINCNGSWLPYYKDFPWAVVPDSDPIYDIVDPLRDLIRDDNVVAMPTFSKWGDETIGVRAKTGAYPHLLLTGVATDCCVLSTAMTAAEAGAFVTVVLDACAASNEDRRIAAKNILEGYAPLIDIKTVEEIVSA